MKSTLPALAFLGTLLLGGCTPSDERDYGGTVDPNAAPDFTQRIKEIEENKNMPESAKAAALADLRARQAESDRRKAAGAK